ncbi:MAG: UDP-3-O-(3-hydroxymyristoyl)glucosamine N-acyltransferase [Bacteroidetes bacterium]|nr:UDP-3-O-(3-hydroxymyristoyl)glucosamine N-acyltransferase [Bacteroidota bacterium]
MKLSSPQPLSELARILGIRFVGDPDHLVMGINEIHRVETGDLTFVDVEKYYKKALQSAATTVLINKEVTPPLGKALLISDDPFRDYNRLTEHFQPRLSMDTVGRKQSIHPSVRLGQHVVMGDHVTIEEGVEIGHHVVIGSHVHIGAHTIVYPQVTIGHYTTIGKHCCLNQGASLGAEAFYYKKREWGREKMLSKGSVRLEDYVEIGAHTCIDRGVSAETRIGEHTKIDNLVQIGHDTVLGKRVLIAAQAAVAGCCVIEDDVIIWGQVGIASSLRIGKGAVILAQSGLMADVPAGKTYLGSPAKESKRQFREIASVEKLPDLLREIDDKRK